MTEDLTSIGVPGRGSVAALRSEPDGAATGCWLLYAPGAGSNVRDPFGAFLAGELAQRGIATLRFQFPYMEEHRRTPDRPPVLEATWRAAIEAARPRASRLVVSGRSMGGRIASQVVAQGAPVDGLALFAYPLHPPGRPDRARDEHLGRLTVPTLFCSGTNDAFGAPDELEATASKVVGSSLHLLEGADHGFAVPKASARSRQDVWAEAVAAFLDWLGSP